MFKLHLPLAAIMALGVASPLLAVPAAQTAPKASTAQAPTRAAMLNQLQNNFKSIDTNGDGSLSAAELQAAEGKVQQQRVGALRARVEAEFTKLDTNHDGQLSKAEFMAAAPSAPTTAPNGSAIISQLDKNKDGKVTLDEYRTPILSRFDSLDTNHDGTLSAAERQAGANRKQ